MASLLRNCAAIVIGMAVALSGCGKKQDGKTIKIGFVAKSQDNTVFQAAHAGARAAAEELAKKYGVKIEVLIQTPEKEDAQKQAEAVDNLVRQGVAGIAISCSDAGPVTPAINRAVDAGVAVICFDSDAPRSKRFCYYGTDDIDCGTRVMKELARAMGERGVVAILAGNASAPNLQQRVEGVRRELKNHPEIKELNDGKGVFNHPEDPSSAAEAWKSATRTNPSITGWALVGGWPLFVKGAVDWDPARIKVVSVDALPAQMSYLKDGSVEMLLAQDCYGWGTKTLEILMEKIVNKKDPPSARIIDPLRPVTKANADEIMKLWDGWLKK
jgi:ribose transport system substrate-binding protein